MNPEPSPLFRHLALAAAISVFGLIVLGGMLRVSGSGAACPDWPTCFGAWTPPSGQNALLDCAHRAATALAACLTLAGALIAWKDLRRQPWITAPMLLALFLLLAQVGLGAWVALHPGAGRAWPSALHLGLSLLVEAPLVMAAVVSFAQPHDSL
jgi:cytochrome c oxidase assembly protein subunit 15